MLTITDTEQWTRTSLAEVPVRRDITLLVGTDRTPIKAHRFALSFLSEKFAQMLFDDGAARSEAETTCGYRWSLASGARCMGCLELSEVC